MDKAHLFSLFDLLGCKLNEGLLKYLGLLLGGSHFLSSFWDPVVEKVERRLTCWKRVYLFFRGKLTLINSVLANILTYFMLVFKMPCRIS